LDEIQSLPNWELFLKRYFDLRYPVKFIISSSASLPLLHKSRESLAGRILEFPVYPFSLVGLAVLKEEKKLEEIFLASRDIWRKFWQEMNWSKLGENLFSLEREVFPLKPKLKLFVENYLLLGGFPEYLQIDQDLRERYFWDSVVERVIHRDIPAIVDVRDRELLRNLLLYAFSFSGTVLNITQLANDFGSTKLSVSNYLRYLEGSLLVHLIEKYARSIESRLRAFKKVITIDPGLYSNIAGISPLRPSWEKEKGVLAEIAVFAKLKREVRNFGLFYWRERDKEVDFVVDFLKGVIPVEVKYRDVIKARDLRGIEEFKRKFKSTKSIIITKEKLEWDGSKLLVPLWLF